MCCCQAFIAQTGLVQDCCRTSLKSGICNQLASNQTPLYHLVSGVYVINIRQRLEVTVGVSQLPLFGNENMIDLGEGWGSRAA
jgi:hypothetical protein